MAAILDFTIVRVIADNDESATLFNIYPGNE